MIEDNYFKFHKYFKLYYKLIKDFLIIKKKFEISNYI